MKKYFSIASIVVYLTASSLLLTFTSLAHAADPFAGQYEKLKSPQSTANSEKVEVLEFFWYGCPHCYELDKRLKPWLKTKKPDYVEFRHVPAVFKIDHRWTLLAKAYYVAEALDVLEKIHTPLFRAIHKERKRELLYDDISLQEFFAQYNVSEDDFTDTLESFGVNTQIRRAMEMTNEKGYALSSVPVIFVNGRYRITADSHYKTRRVLDYLIEKERRRMRLPR